MKRINNNIEEQRVSFDNAKLLKEKGFDVVTDLIYMTNHTSIVLFDNINSLKHSDSNNPFVSAPTQQVAIDWIIINFGIHIILDWNGDEYFCATRKVVDSKMVIDVFGLRFNTPKEAKEAAINHVLTNLI
jgi:hypothetical protein